MSRILNGQLRWEETFKAQPKPPLPISLRTEAYHRGLQNFIESSRVASQKGKVAVVFVSAQRAGRLVKVRGTQECFFKASFGHH